MAESQPQPPAHRPPAHAATCSRCPRPLDRLSQGVIPGTGVPALCAACGRADEARDLLRELPAKGSADFNRLRKIDQTRLQAARRVFGRSGTVSEAQLGFLAAIKEALR